MSDFKTVHFKVKDNRLVADPTDVFVTRCETLISFQLQIPGLAFANVDREKNEYPIQMLSGFESFLPSWRVTPNTAALLDLNNIFGDFEYIAWVIRADQVSPTPFRLVFQTKLMIHNAIA